ncbi:MAG: hypothetical protein LC808_24110 [Actinobacteria bacterium]|nr:hypothetical protein [Actinomycetota bacterium]
MRDRTAIDDRVNDVLIGVVRDDIDFSEPLRLSLDREALSRWRPYKERLLTSRPERTFLVDKYCMAIASLRDSGMGIEAVRLSNDEYEYAKLPSASGRNHFRILVAGLRRHYDLMASDEERQLLVDSFRRATSNPTLTQQLFPGDPDAVQ